MDFIVSPEVLDKAKADLKKYHDGWAGGLCKGDCRSLEGKALAASHGACHSWLATPYSQITNGSGYSSEWRTTYKKDAAPFLLLNAHSKKRSRGVCSPEAHEAFIFWIARESPFSFAILNRDDDASLRNGGIIALCGPTGLTQAQAMWVCKALRYSLEGSNALDTWLALKEGGVNPLLAVLVGSRVRTLTGATFGYTGVAAHVDVFGGYYRNDPVVDLQMLATGTINPDATDTYSVFAPKGTHKDTPGKKMETVFENFCKPIVKSDGWGGSISGNGAKKEELLAAVLKWQSDLSLPATYDNSLPALPRMEVPPPLPTASTVYLELDL